MNQMMLMSEKSQLNADRMLFKRDADSAFTYNVIAERPVSTHDATRDVHYSQFYNPPSTPAAVYYMRVNQMHPVGGVSYVHRPLNTLMPTTPMVYSIYNTLNTVRSVVPTSKVEVVRKVRLTDTTPW